VKELTVPRKPLPPEPVKDKVLEVSPRSNGRKGSVLMAGGAKEALVAMSRAATQAAKEQEEEEDLAGQNYMAIDQSAIGGGGGGGGGGGDDEDENPGSDMYKAVDHEELAALPPAPKPPVGKKKANPALVRVANDDDGPGGYKSIDNTALEEEMEQVLQERMPVKVRGRTSSIMTRVVREKDEWRDMDSFNARFQEAVETMNMHGAQSNTRRKELIESCLTVIRLAQDFATLASQYGKTIISEHALPESKKTIKPRKDLGGVLGGEKFIVLGILFKFATDEKNLFKSLSDPLEAANKIAGLELKGLKVFCFVFGKRRCSKKFVLFEISVTFQRELRICPFH